MKALRVKLEPIGGTASSTGTARGVRGATVRLSALGAGKSKAIRDSSVPASLTFRARFFKAIRDDSGTEPETLATLSGTLQVSTAGDPKFLLDVGEGAPPPLEPETPLEDADDPKASSQPRRTIELAFDPAQFVGFGAPLDLVLPAEAEDFRFVEIDVRLEVAGALEAGPELNDVLDVPLLPGSPEFVPALEVRIVDEIGEPVGALAVEFEVGGEAVSKSTDERGVARRFVTDTTVANVTLPSPSDLRSALKSRWDQIRGRARLKRSERLQTVLVRDDMDSTFPVEAGVPTIVSLQPRVERARLVRFFHDLNKTFILPDLPEALDTIRELYSRNKPSKLLIVGHTDRSGDAAYNDQLSLERAETLLAYLKDDVDGWLEWYGDGISAKKRWGSAEDLAMLGALPDLKTPGDPGETPVVRFQRTRGLKVDGIAGPETRRQLVTEYLALDSASLPAEIEATVHGAGENFPDSRSADGTRVPDDRRAELFFFDAELGIQPPPPGKNSKAGSKQYPEWVRRADNTDVTGSEFRSLAIRIIDPMNAPLVNAPYQLEVGSDRRKGRSDDNGFLIETNVPVPNRCTLSWTYPDPDADPDAEPAEFLFRREVFLNYADPDAGDQREGARRRLHNLGYLDDSFDANVLAFQRDVSLPEGAFDQATFDRLRELHDVV